VRGHEYEYEYRCAEYKYEDEYEYEYRGRVGVGVGVGGRKEAGEDKQRNGRAKSLTILGESEPVVPQTILPLDSKKVTIVA
jgi:hypothetical protein